MGQIKRNKTAGKYMRKGRKRHTDSLFLPLLAAGIVAVLMICACFWGISSIRASKENNGPGLTTHSRENFVLPRIDRTTISERNGSPTNSTLTDSEKLAVLGAITDLQSLPFEEPLQKSILDGINLVDYAIMQTAWKHNLSAGHIRLNESEERRHNSQPYPFHTYDMLTEQGASAFIISLRDSLNAWGGTAAMRRIAPNQWMINISGADTHLLLLHSTRESFLTGAATRPTPEEQGRLRMRRSGEQAKLVIVIDDLGESMADIRELIALDYPVTFSFWPHATHTEKGARAAHGAGREVMIHQPMEPQGYPQMNPGPGTLFVGTPAENIKRQLESAIARVPYAVGLNNHMGSRFTLDSAGTAVVASVLKEYGLFLLDSLTDPRSVLAREGTRAGAKTFRRNIFLDDVKTEKAIRLELAKAEKIALLTGQCIAIGHPRKETIAVLKEWQRTRNKDIAIVRLGDL